VNRAALVILVAAGAVAAIAYRQTRGLDNAAAPEPEAGGVWDIAAQNLGDFTSLDYWTGHNSAETTANIEEALTMIDGNQNVRAFLEAIAKCEGTTQGADPYRVCYAFKNVIDGRDGISGTYDDWVDHPSVTGEWKGEKLSDKLCSAAGLGPGCVSTAAGKYQITRTTWDLLKRKLKLKDFSPASQDAAAIELLRECGALPLVEVGNVAGAVTKARRIWASLPGAGYKQPERSLAWVQSQYQQAGGVIA
jgi:lysozyme